MIELDKHVQEFVGNNWLTIAIVLLILKGVARQFGIKALHKIYFVIQNAYSIVRPGTAKDTLAKINNETNNQPKPVER